MRSMLMSAAALRSPIGRGLLGARRAGVHRDHVDAARTEPVGQVLGHGRDADVAQGRHHAHEVT
jgi:hypothetical protein